MSTDRPEVAPPAPGEVIGPLEVGAPAHGGHAVARHEGRVVFVRHAAPGERVMARVSDDSAKNFLRADAVEVLVAAEHRVTPRCPIVALCGGCDLQHLDRVGQLEWKTAVLAEQLQRLAQITDPVPVQAVQDHAPVVLPPLDTTGSQGWHWRTRMRYRATTEPGTEAVRAGLRGARSHEVVPLPTIGCSIAGRALPGPVELDRLLTQSGADQAQVTAADNGVARISGPVREGPALMEHRVLDRRYGVSPQGFWQVHPQAPDVLAATVLEALSPAAGEHALDLYCGVGVFAGALVDAGARVTGIEIDRRAIEQARRNVPQARFHAGPVDKMVRRVKGPVDLVVIDPARAGAGRRVIDQIDALGPRAIAHIGCDPAAFARDLSDYRCRGWRIGRLAAFDLFPQTHHLEAFALLLR